MGEVAARMRTAARLLALVLLVVAFPAAGLTGCARAQAAGANTATLVIDAGPGEVQTRCVAFDEQEITGLDLLRRSGVEAVWQDYGGGNVTVCRIGDTGCDYPRTSCFCRCADTRRCDFWGYYTVSGGAWSFSQTGAGLRRVGDGEVHGWRWGRQSDDGGAPPTVEPDAIRCPDPVAVVATGGSAQGGARLAGLAGIVALLVALGVWQVVGRRRRDADA